MNASELTFGIEVECYISRENLQAAGWEVGGYHNGREIPDFVGWNAQRDSSLNSPPSYELAGVEVVSGVLTGAEGLAEVRRMLATLQRMGAKVNRTCGFHVHVGFAGRSVQELRRLVCLVASHEEALYAVTGSRARRDSCYCKSVKDGAMNGFARPVRSHREASGWCDRFRVLNLTNLLGDSARKPTVEFRVFAGTTNEVKILGYIQLCLGLVSKAVAMRSAAPWHSRPVHNKSLAGYGPGRTAVSKLLWQLGWRGDAAHHGVLDLAGVAKTKTELYRLAKKYDSGSEE